MYRSARFLQEKDLPGCAQTPICSHTHLSPAQQQLTHCTAEPPARHSTVGSGPAPEDSAKHLMEQTLCFPREQEELCKQSPPPTSHCSYTEQQSSTTKTKATFNSSCCSCTQLRAASSALQHPAESTVQEKGQAASSGGTRPFLASLDCLLHST